MVNLGFIRDAKQRPADTPRVYLRRAGASLHEARPTICAWSDRATQRYELCWEVPSNAGRVAEWSKSMADSIRDLGWNEWWLDPGSFSAALGHSVTDALVLWGKAFWPHYTADSVVYIKIGDTMRETAYESVRAWQKAFPHVVFDSSYDIDLRERQEAEARRNATLPERMAGLFTRIRERL
jgi:hypothetical protein